MVDDNTFCKFVNNELLHDEMIATEKELIANGEGAAVLNASVLNYQVNKEEIDDLLGVDSKEISQESEKKLEKFVEIAEESLSIPVTDKQSFTKNNNIMKTYSQSTIKSVINSVKNNQAEIKALPDEIKAKGFEVAAQEYLAANGIDANAKEVAAEIKEGLDLFEANLKQSEEEHRISYSELISETIAKNKSEEKCKEIFATFLAALSAQSVEEAEEKKKEYANEELSELKNKVEAALENSIISNDAMKSIEALLDKSEVSELCELMNARKEEYKLATALWLYSAQRNGEIDLKIDDSTEIPAQAFGALAGAGIEAMLAKKTHGLKNWQEWLKIILGAAIATLFLIFACYSSVLVTIDILMPLFFFLGGGMFAVIVSLIAGFVLVKYIIGAYDKVLEGLMELLGALYDRWIEPITDKTKSLWEWTKNFFNEVVFGPAEETDSEATVENIPEPTEETKPEPTVVTEPDTVLNSESKPEQETAGQPETKPISEQPHRHEIKVEKKPVTA